VNDWRWNADWFNHVGGLVQKYNMQFVYRNHNFEFRKHASGIEFDELLQRTEPSRVMLEFDCGWAAIAGYDPVAFLKRHGDRVAMLHLSEPPRGFTSSTGPGAPEPEAPLGNGTIDWPAVLNAAKAAGVRRSFVDAPPARMRAAYKFLVG
jgi:sugar phosphate isomerase/epimerase